MISKEKVLERTNKGLDIFKFYVDTKWRIGRNFLNPLYEDTKASCNIYLDKKNNIYKIKDFGNDDYNGDCFSYVGIMNNLDCYNGIDFVKILDIINRDMSLGINNVSVSDDNKNSNNSKSVIRNQNNDIEIKKIDSEYNIYLKKMTSEELDFWGNYGINIDILTKYNVVSLKEFRSENSKGLKYSYVSTIEEPIYAYQFNTFVKIYRPYSKLRFLYGGILNNTYCFGFKQLPEKGDLLFITGGEKDVMTLCAHGFNGICFNSETAIISREIIYELHLRFTHIFLLFDMDKTGIESSNKQVKKLSEFNIQRLELPMSGEKSSKDISDYFKLGYSREDFIKLFMHSLDKLYFETMVFLKSHAIKLDVPPMRLVSLISANDVPLATPGNILCVTGSEGTGKSNYVLALVAGTLGDKDVDSLGVDVNPNKSHKAVLVYDTEQSEVQLYKNVFNALKRAGLKSHPNEFKVFGLVTRSRKERLKTIKESIDLFYYKYGGIQMIVIDGIADLVKSTNDEVESIEVIEELYKLARIYNTCIITVLHLVPNGLKLRGHLGSELQRKAATILSIEQDKDQLTSVVKALKVRDGSPLDVPLMQFSWSKTKEMHVYIGNKSREIKKQRKEKELGNITKDLFIQDKFITFTNLCSHIQKVMDVKDRTAKNYIKFMLEQEIILKDPSNQNYYIEGNYNK